MKNKLINIKIFTLILILGSFLLGVTKVNAQNVSIGIFPPIMQMDTTPPANVNADFYVQNQSDTSVDLNIVFKPFKPANNKNGEIEIIDSIASFPDPLFINRIKVLDQGEPIKTLTIGPKQTQKLVLEVTLPPNEQKGDYYFTVFFVSKPLSSLKSNSTLASATIGMNVLLTVGPKGKTEGGITRFETPFFVNSGPIPFKVEVANRSDHFFAPTGEIIIKNMLGAKKGKVKLMPVNILSNSTRYIPDITQANIESEGYKKIAEAVEDQSFPVAVFPQKFFLGIYTATLNVSLEENGPTFTKSITFFAFPITYILTIFIVLGLIVFISLRVKKKIN